MGASPVEAGGIPVGFEGREGGREQVVTDGFGVRIEIMRDGPSASVFDLALDLLLQRSAQARRGAHEAGRPGG